MDADDAAPQHSSPTPAPDLEPSLLQALEESRRLGFLGSRPIPDVVAHSRRFVDALLASSGSTSHGAHPNLLDLGSGGGVPGLVIAHDLLLARVTMLDRRRTRTDFLARVVHRLEWTERVDVLTQDAARPHPPQRESFDAVVARGFGPPQTTLRLAALWARPHGLIVISEPPTGDRWAEIDLAEYGVARLPPHTPNVVVFRRH